MYYYKKKLGLKYAPNNSGPDLFIFELVAFLLKL